MIAARFPRYLRLSVPIQNLKRQVMHNEHPRTDVEGVNSAPSKSAMESAAPIQCLTEYNAYQKIHPNSTTVLFTCTNIKRLSCVSRVSLRADAYLRLRVGMLCHS